MFVKPTRDGLIIPFPDRRTPLAAEGEDVPENTYWLRILRDGDIARVAPPPAPKEE